MIIPRLVRWENTSFPIKLLSVTFRPSKEVAVEKVQMAKLFNFCGVYTPKTDNRHTYRQQELHLQEIAILDVFIAKELQDLLPGHNW